jgi:hypothetical protein
VRIFSLSWCSKPLKLRDCLKRYRSSGFVWKNTSDSCSMPPITKYRYDSSPNDALRNKNRSMSIERNTKNSTKYARLSITRMKCSRINSATSISHSSRSMRPKRTRVMILRRRFKSGNQDTKLRRRARPRSWKISGTWWRVKGSQWLIVRFERWPFDSKTKDPPLRTRSENVESYSKIAIAKSKTISKNAKNMKSPSCNSETTKILSTITRINLPYWINNS